MQMRRLRKPRAFSAECMGIDLHPSPGLRVFANIHSAVAIPYNSINRLLLREFAAEKP